jgi:hypothetical protein
MAEAWPIHRVHSEHGRQFLPFGAKIASALTMKFLSQPCHFDSDAIAMFAHLFG